MPRNTPPTNLDHESLDFFCSGTVVQLLNAAIIYIHNTLTYNQKHQSRSLTTSCGSVTCLSLALLFNSGAFTLSTQMVSLIRIITVLTALSLPGINSFLPVMWRGLFSPLSFLVTTKWGVRGDQMLTAGQATGIHISDIIENCSDAEENTMDTLEFVDAISQTACGLALAIMGY